MSEIILDMVRQADGDWSIDGHPETLLQEMGYGLCDGGVCEYYPGMGSAAREAFLFLSEEYVDGYLQWTVRRSQDVGEAVHALLSESGRMVSVFPEFLGVLGEYGYVNGSTFWMNVCKSDV